MLHAAGPKGSGFMKRMEFGPVRVAAKLRQEGNAPAQELAARIEADLRNIPQLVAAEVETVTLRSPLGMIGTRLVRVTPALLQALMEMDLRLRLSRNVSAQLAANPNWSEYEKLLW